MKSRPKKWLQPNLFADDQQRAARRFGISQDDQRTRYQRDRDRILYSSAFQRLAGVTQIVRAGEADVFHTRQQHSIKVAQVGRRLAENCLADQNQLPLAKKYGLDSEVVEAACLAHDLGHPPFGHIGEHALNHLVERAGDQDGFEGNAQSFRILTRLSVRYYECKGLDLTRATLAAGLKYPWLRQKDETKKRSKWSAYRSDEQDFEFAIEHTEKERRTLEADLMDWADDIAYSVHDLEDFHRCGAIPWQKIFSDENEQEFVLSIKQNWFEPPLDAEEKIRKAIRNIRRNILEIFPAVTRETYDGSRQQRQQIRNMTSLLIGRYITAAKVVEDDFDRILEIDEALLVEVKVLKQVTRDYVISIPALAAQQFGQKKIINDLFEIILNETDDRPPKFLPPRLFYLFEKGIENKPRFVADCIASLTENEAIGMHGRLTGLHSGSVLDPIVR